MKLRGFGDGRKDNKLSQYYQNNLSSSLEDSKMSAEKDVKKRGKGRWEEKASAPPDTISLTKEGLPWSSGKTDVATWAPSTSHDTG